MNKQTNVLKSAGKMFRIIEHIKNEGETTVTKLANDFNMPKSTAQMYLNTLNASNFVVKREGRYELGLQFLEYGMFVLRNEPLFPVVRSRIEELAESTGELAACFVEERGEAVFIYGVEGEQSVRTNLSMGDRTDLHCIASGKAILAHLPEDRVFEIINGKGLEAKTEQTITDPQELLDELDQIREQGHAYSRQESLEGVRVVAAPIRLDGRILGSISLAGPVNRFVGERFDEEIPDLIKGAANEIELKLTHSRSGF